jgi:transposase
MRFSDVLDRTERSALSQLEAAELLGTSERTFRRWRDRYREEGPAGLADRRIGPSLRRASVTEIERMLGLYRDLYRGFTVKHFHEHLAKRHGYTLGYTVTKLHLHRAGLVAPARTRSAHRKKRPRRPMVGMLLHQDASTHAWLAGEAGKQDLVVTMEDATSALYSAFLVDQEGTASSLRGVRDVVAKHGLFCSLYTDRGSHYFLTPEAGGRVSKTVLTQFGRALKQLGIEHIAAYSPQARGRSERMFGTLQDRLPKELALAGITTIEAANHWLAETYIADHNKRFAITAEQEGSAFVAAATGAWREILCIQEDRAVGNDNTVKWQRVSLQLPPCRLRPHFVKATVRVHQYPDGQLAVFWGPHRLADYDAHGTIILPEQQAA